MTAALSIFNSTTLSISKVGNNETINILLLKSKSILIFILCALFYLSALSRDVTSARNCFSFIRLNDGNSDEPKKVSSTMT